MSFLIESRRLRIRPWTASDRDTITALATDPQVVQYIADGRLWSEEEIDSFLRREAQVLELYGLCFGALELKETGAVIGLAGLQPLGTTGDTEVGWWLFPEHWKHGYATEAGQAAIEYAFSKLGLRRVVAITHPDNKPSRRVMDRLGMRFVEATTGHELGLRVAEVSLVLYRLERD